MTGVLPKKSSTRLPISRRTPSKRRRDCGERGVSSFFTSTFLVVFAMTAPSTTELAPPPIQVDLHRRRVKVPLVKMWRSIYYGWGNVGQRQSPARRPALFGPSILEVITVIRPRRQAELTGPGGCNPVATSRSPGRSHSHHFNKAWVAIRSPLARALRIPPLAHVRSTADPGLVVTAARQVRWQLSSAIHHDQSAPATREPVGQTRLS
jgi:hypothetical protein